jgi:hypothetical protein
VAKDAGQAEVILTSLISRLSFASWFHDNISPQLDAPAYASPPSARYRMILLTLSEIAQISATPPPNSDPVITFCLLFRRGHEDSLTSYLLPPHSITWARSPCTPSSPALRPPSARRALRLARHCRARRSRLRGHPQAVQRFHDLPAALAVLRGHALSHVHLHALFNILNSGIYRFRKLDGFDESFRRLYRAARPFLGFPEFPELCGVALSITGKFLDEYAVPERDADAVRRGRRANSP